MRNNILKFKNFLRFYGPYLGAGVKVESVSEDGLEIVVSLTIRWFNRNLFGTHFGGSLYSMVDPHFVFILVNALGKDYIVWDKGAEIEFIKATKKKAFATFKLSPEQIQDVRDNTANGDKYLPQYNVEIVDAEGELIARVKKTLYIRKKQRAVEKGL